MGMVALTEQLITPRYTATSLVMMQPRPTRVIDLEAVVSDLAPDESSVETQIRVLTSRELAEQVAQELGLFSDPEFNPALKEQVDRSAVLASWFPDAAHEAGALATRLGEWLDHYRPTTVGVADEAQPETDGPPPSEGSGDSPASSPHEAVVANFLKKLDVSRGGRSFAISVDFTSTDPAKAARIANAVARAYVDRQLAGKETATSEATQWLTERVEQLRDRVLTSERAVEEYRAANQLLDGSGTGLNEQQLASLTARLIDVRAERDEKEAQLAQVREVIESGAGYDALAEVMSSPVILMLREQETTLLRQRAQLSREYGERHPMMLQLEAERQDLAAKIEREGRNVIQSLESEVRVAARREEALEQSLLEAKGQSSVISRARIQLSELEREAAANRSIYETFLARLAETREQQDLLQADARVISTAFVPAEPSFPKPRLMLVSGFLMSLTTGLLLAFLTEHLDRGLHAGRHLEQRLGVSNLGLVPTVRRLRRRQRHHQYLLEEPLSEYAEAIRSVRKSLQLLNIDQPPKVVMVTSTLPGEGKTTLATSLAASMASSSFNTMLVDLDLRHPSVARELTQPVSHDLLDFMTGRASLDEVIHSDPSVEGLAYIPIKQLTRSPLNLLESEKMSWLIAQLRTRYDYVVLDTPPTLGITDARATARLADAVLFVVRWRRTKAEPALRGLELLMESHARVAGAVMTQVNLRKLAKLAYGDPGEYYKAYKAYYQG
jgi:capsular exopolysaccharide synthesis family protein